MAVSRKFTGNQTPLLQLVRQPGQTIREDRRGLQTARTTYVCDISRVFDLAPRTNAVHPQFANLFLEKKEIIEQKLEMATVICDYTGISYRGSTPGAVGPVYTLDIQVAEQPIETHPNFLVTQMGFSKSIVEAAGGESDSKAVFNDDGTFSGFGKDSENNLVGVQSYFDANQILWTKSTVSENRPLSVNDAGKIDTPEGNPPNLPLGQNWLNMGIRYTERAGVFDIQEVWKASGRQGWNNFIYAQP